MKKLFLILAMLISTSVCSQWNWQNPYPTVNDLNSVSFANTMTGWIAGYNGTLIKTSDGGSKWTLIQSIMDCNIYSIKFFNESTGYASGSNLYKSTNGGLNWTQKTIPMTDAKKSFFLDLNTGWVGTYSGQIWKTTNGGTSWRWAQVLETQIHDLYFIDAMTGWVVAGLGGIYKTNDAGNSWISQKNQATVNLNAVYFKDANTGWIAGDDGTLLTTFNGGEDWTEQIITSSYLLSINFVNSSTGFVSGSYGTVLKTTNGGISWLLQASNDNHNLYSVMFLNSTTGIIAGKSGAIIKTTNGGSNWKSMSYMTTAELNSVHFINDYTGWTVGTNGAIFKSSNSGANWTQQQGNTNITYRGIFALNTDNAYIVGDSGRILLTNNGGQSWIKQQSGTKSDLYSVFFINSDVGWISGDSGVILKTTNRGANWITQYGIGINKGYSIYFIDNNTGWVGCGDIYKSTDGGEKWVKKSNIGCKSICFANAMTGFAVGGTAVVKSTDGGETWGSISSGDNDSPPANVRSISFMNESKGWYAVNHTFECKILGFVGTNIGAAINTGHNYLNCVYATRTGYAWAVGENGTIVRTSNGGLTFNNGNVYETPSEFTLYQNYPNPFNPVTTIKFSVPRASEILISVYDITGKRIEVLANGKFQQGNYQINWNGENYSSGVYFYKITSGEFSETKKMLLIK